MFIINFFTNHNLQFQQVVEESESVTLSVSTYSFQIGTNVYLHLHQIVFFLKLKPLYFLQAWRSSRLSSSTYSIFWFVVEGKIKIKIRLLLFAYPLQFGMLLDDLINSKPRAICKFQRTDHCHIVHATKYTPHLFHVSPQLYYTALLYRGCIICNWVYKSSLFFCPCM